MAMTRTQIYLADDERDLLDRASQLTGASTSELIRRAIRTTYGRPLTKEEKLAAMRAAAGSWADREFTGAEYVEAIRGRDSEQRRRVLGLE